MTQHVYRSTAQIPPYPVQAARPEPGVVFGNLLFEVTLSGPASLSSTELTVPGWTLRLWPQARLGDATLEARPECSESEDISALLCALAEAGVGLLGPVRRRQI
jgi:hypothetical protein